MIDLSHISVTVDFIDSDGRWYAHIERPEGQPDAVVLFDPVPPDHPPDWWRAAVGVLRAATAFMWFDSPPEKEPGCPWVLRLLVWYGSDRARATAALLPFVSWARELAEQSRSGSS